MELYMAIALLCQVSTGNPSVYPSRQVQLECHQSYVHCINMKTISLSKEEALNKCILEDTYPKRK